MAYVNRTEILSHASMYLDMIFVFQCCDNLLICFGHTLLVTFLVFVTDILCAIIQLWCMAQATFAIL